MKFDDEILVNQFGQDLVPLDSLLLKFDSFDLNQKRDFLNYMIELIIQSKAHDSDIEDVITNSGLKATYTPCVMLKMGVAPHLLLKIINLPEHELKKTLTLFLHLFRVAYQRRFELERDLPCKWWYWDMSVDGVIQKIKEEFG